MLLIHDKWRQFTSKEIPDAHTCAQVLLCLSADSKEAVNELVECARSAGGIADPTPVQDHGFMFGRSFEDPDGHIWEVAWMDFSAMPNGNVPPH
ncbi:VOC family protein [Sphingorhabdus sp.]|uniref:VOC family protein n=1 Tax=Sphingorhabdus sp. TaxID=1902408 RepID=UPI0039195D61